MDSVEAALQTHITKAFIDADAVQVLLLRPGTVANGAGGTRRGVATAQSAQTVRLVPAADPVVAQTPQVDGGASTTKYVLLGLPGMNIANGDYFLYDGHTFDVSEVRRVGGYETKATVTSRD